jgi:hypothetical protein
MPDVPDEVKQSLKFHFAENVDQVLDVALGTRTHNPRIPRHETPETTKEHANGKHQHHKAKGKAGSSAK